ncbi:MULTISPECIES: NfeD family protein [Edwardsiella]|uniref:NfeD family protein n=2 Tax=Edwardsiella anguillarum TaxID=1821960 RepID=A0ABY8SHF5_9GAMM|nr:MULTISPECIES: NfeD family protein [Edwardsiella]AIJ09414.1 Putative activity regulator of membrane protease YbbK [Edwardsiella anguillarum ET080813]AKR77229.1 NfeD family protein [Edwardsiella sp. LADL05-105]KAB0590452.1 NfeD family protein [Edwardsiella anguillarum]UOU80061.1 NfeD family protein [Edwardsiella anguillarum]WHP84915.1 NfeD family protein [Edwardsiella anguillarum]
MMAYLLQNPHGLWLTLGGLLLAAELLGAGGYALWSGCAALLVGLLHWLWPFGWEAQLTLFALLTVISALLWWRWQRRGAAEEGADSVLNQRGRQLIGQRALLEQPLVNGHGRLRLGDSSWRVTCAQDLPAGQCVQVRAVSGITLEVIPCAPPRDSSRPDR